jgi:hypothetical protein
MRIRIPSTGFFPSQTTYLWCRLPEGGVRERQAGGLPAGGEVTVQGVPGLLNVPGRAAGAGQPLPEPQVTQSTSFYFKCFTFHVVTS